MATAPVLTLKPCPFCHSYDVSCRNRYDGWVVQCRGCAVTMVHLASYVDALAAWNTRPETITAEWLNHTLPKN